MHSLTQSTHPWHGCEQGVFEFMSSKGIKQQPVGLQVMVHGTVPTGEPPTHPVHQLPSRFRLMPHPRAPARVVHRTGAGVSSSAAFVCSSALALLGAFGVEASPSVRVPAPPHLQLPAFVLRRRWRVQLIRFCHLSSACCPGSTRAGSKHQPVGAEAALPICCALLSCLKTQESVRCRIEPGNHSPPHCFAVLI